MINQISWESVKEIFEQLPLDIGTEDLKDVTCGICNGIIVDACQIICGCQFCRRCIESYLSNGFQKCPAKPSTDCHNVTILSMDDVHGEKDINSKVLKLKVKCPICNFAEEMVEMIPHWDMCKKENVTSPSVSDITEWEVTKKITTSKNKESVEDLKIKINSLRRKNKKLEKVVEEMNLRISNLERDKWKFNETVHSLREQIEKEKFEPFVWVVDKFNGHRKSNHCLYSEPFFLFKGGYKMRLCLYPNGAYDSRFVSLYFGLIRGEYDMLLEWPFSYNVTLSLLDHRTGDSHNHTVYYLHHKGRSYVYQRPSGYTNVVLGASEFIEYALLNESNYFIKKDVIFITCSVAKSPSSFALDDSEMIC